MNNTKSNEYLLEVKGLKKYFNISKGWLKGEKQYLRAVDGIDFKVRHGETLGIVGESGCGKSTTANLLVRLLKPTAGEIIFDGKNLLKLSSEDMRKMRADIQMVFQDPFSSLNPRMRVFDIIAEPLLVHGRSRGKELEQEVYELLDVVGLSRSYARRFPHEFSGGQRQRIGIARALALKPKLIICDEPVSALDVSIQAQILNLLNSLQNEFNLTYIFIAHGLPAVKHVSDHIAVMYLGKIVEIAPKEKLFEHSMHPYTEGLLAAIPISSPFQRKDKKRIVLSGDIPNPANPPSGCRFHTRCSYCNEKCRNDVPELIETEPDHFVACHYPL